jgi:prepilin-type N-terminal cleavage/methylation domain-containing protein
MHKVKRQAGFTIIELLIATVVFAMVLMLITYGVISFSKAYLKGVNQSRTQNVARNIVESVAQSIQFSGGQVTVYVPVGGVRGFCIDNQRYSYVTGVQLTESNTPTANQSRRVMVLDEPGNCGGLTPQNVRGAVNTVLGKEQLSNGMRLAKLNVAQIGTTPMYRVQARVVYGDDELLCSPSANDCGNTAASTNLNRDDLVCKSAISGSQYCAVSELSTIVKKRLNQTP